MKEPDGRGRKMVNRRCGGPRRVLDDCVTFFELQVQFIRYGYHTAVWCQRYELFCNEKQRRNKAQELITLMQDAVRVHYRYGF
ncbi:hypothetical protein ANCDUO_24191 [Ancylostoma duodenale]|uniref:Uncharacterized protein n=1 Tax=Ancylostoma duodenale TaxID=51022 RepID=A0A0C2BPM3_9BILA|nr:hypothetical protein ANCDUO_24191 [Ancylostoma duodenale]